MHVARKGDRYVLHGFRLNMDETKVGAFIT